MNRREFGKLAMAALGGVAAGARMGLADEKAPEKPAEEVNPLLEEPHVCRGLNTCKGKGKGGTNECAGTGACSAVAAHTCGGQNDCKGQGGCGTNPGENACKGKGACHVPLNDKAWKKARARFEELMTKAGKKVGEAPAK